MSALRAIKLAAQHIFNPLHVYCRLVDCKVQRKTARRIIAFYERVIYKPIAGPK